MLIDGIEVIDSFSFGLGIIFFMVCEVIFAFINFLIQKAFEIREYRRFLKEVNYDPQAFKDYLRIKDIYFKIKEQR